MGMGFRCEMAEWEQVWSKLEQWKTRGGVIVEWMVTVTWCNSWHILLMFFGFITTFKGFFMWAWCWITEPSNQTLCFSILIQTNDTHYVHMQTLYIYGNSHKSHSKVQIPGLLNRNSIYLQPLDFLPELMAQSECHPDILLYISSSVWSKQFWIWVPPWLEHQGYWSQLLQFIRFLVGSFLQLL